MSFVITRFVTRGQLLSFVVPLVVTRCHSLSLVVPLVVTRCNIRLSFYRRSKFYVIFHFLSLCAFISIQKTGRSIPLRKTLQSKKLFWEQYKICIKRFVFFKPRSYCFEETIILRKGLVCKASSVTSHQTRWYNKKNFKKSYSVPRDFSWTENYKL